MFLEHALEGLSKVNSDLVTPLSDKPYGGYTMGESRYVRRSRYRQVDLALSVHAALQKDQSVTVAFLPEGFRPDNYRLVNAYLIDANGARVVVEAYCYSTGEIKVISPVANNSYWVYVSGNYFI